MKIYLKDGERVLGKGGASILFHETSSLLWRVVLREMRKVLDVKVYTLSGGEGVLLVQGLKKNSDRV